MEFDQFQINDRKQQKEYFEFVVNKALEGKQSKFTFLRNLKMRKLAIEYKRDTKKAVKLFNNLSSGLIKQYAEKINLGIQDVETLLAAKQFDMCKQYYINENKLAKDMLSEYRTYLFSGHIFDQLIMNATRPDEECVDYRKLPIKWF